MLWETSTRKYFLGLEKQNIGKMITKLEITDDREMFQKVSRSLIDLSLINKVDMVCLSPVGYGV